MISCVSYAPCVTYILGGRQWEDLKHDIKLCSRCREPLMYREKQLCQIFANGKAGKTIAKRSPCFYWSSPFRNPLPLAILSLKPYTIQGRHPYEKRRTCHQSFRIRVESKGWWHVVSTDHEFGPSSAAEMWEQQETCDGEQILWGRVSAKLTVTTNSQCW